MSCLQDNYVWLLQEKESGKVAVVDPSEYKPVASAIHDRCSSKAPCASRADQACACSVAKMQHSKLCNLPIALCRGLKLDYILNTHHHWDHTGGNEELKRKFNCTIVGPKADEGRIPGIDVALADGESWSFGNLEMQVFDTPGHTRGHITLWFPQIQALFPGKLTLLAVCCSFPVKQVQCSHLSCL